MGLLDSILNLVGLLLWFNWRAARFDPLSKSVPATLAGTLRRAEKTSFRRWHLPLALLALLLVRAWLYAEFGRALNWTFKLNIGVISIPFNANQTSILPMLLYSIYSFGVWLVIFLLWVLLLSALKANAGEQDSLRQLLRLHLGRAESWSVPLKLLLPFLVVTPLWYAASWPLTHWNILPHPVAWLQRVEQALLVGAGSYLAWKYLVVALLALYFIHGYVYFGRNPFWQHLDVLGRQLLTPLRALPLRLGKMNLAPLLGIALVLLVANIAEHGIELPWGHDAAGRPKPRWLDVPGLVDLYRRASG